ncbi:hypothetical protein EDC04DRAFT_2540108, partial [Pisolithus marmoratus]
NSAEKIHWVYHDWLTGDHAWELQSLLPPGAMLLGVVLSLDKMHMTTFGDHQAHPLLISLANICRNARNKVLNHAYLPLALMPILQFVYPNKQLQGILADRLLHHVIDIVV